MIEPYWQSEDGRHVVYCGDCREVVPQLGVVDAVVTDPPYGMGKGDWDSHVPVWLPLINKIPVATFCGVVGMRNYPPPDWCGAWVRIASTQRCGRFLGFNNWEPILFYNIPRLMNDVIVCANIHDKNGHPTVKPIPLMIELVSRMPGGIILDPFAGSGTTAVACARLGRRSISIELEPRYCDIIIRRLEGELAQPFLIPPASAKQEALFV